MSIVIPQSLKPERIQFYFEKLVGWVLLEEFNPETRRDEPTGFWTVFEMADHLDACELVAELGALADNWCAVPDIDIRDNLVYVTCGTRDRGLYIEDFDFAMAVDLEIGNGQRPASLLGR
jgi:pterin-4a-carbinolamine dehydratase